MERQTTFKIRRKDQKIEGSTQTSCISQRNSNKAKSRVVKTLGRYYIPVKWRGEVRDKGNEVEEMQEFFDQSLFQVGLLTDTIV